uniref:G-protein coupled receptors family 1 profile domain-containing protein n=1 Tax=Sus scrofa TaxID=9823 RepID=A0A286ZNM9_PIG
MKNQSREIEFILLGLTDDPQLQTVIFIFLFLNYMLSVMGNLSIILLILLDPRLKTPMYFFLQNFSFLEVSLTTVCIPRFLISIITKNKIISYNGCASQLFFFLVLAITEFYLLAAMSFDRYVAICKPLHYPIIMSKKVCYQLVLSSWAAGFLLTFPPVVLGLKLEFCASKVIDHFICDTSPVLQISCTDTHILELISFFSSAINLMVTLLSVIFSYTYIIKTILKIPSAQKRTKAFSTCSSHMIVVSLTYGSCIFIYMKPSAKERVTLSKGVAVIYTSVAPLLNPFIYTLRNQQVKQAFKDTLQKPPLPKKARTARPGREKSAYILRQSILVKLPGGRASWVLSGSAICSLPQGVPYSCRTAAQHRQPPARAPQPKNIRASSAQPSDLPPSWCRPPSPVCPQKVLLCFRETLSALPTLQKSHTASKKTDKQHQPSGNIPQQ